MGRASTPSFVLNVELPTRSDSVLEALCRKKENCGRALYNLTFGLVLKNLRQLWADPRYRELIKAKQEAEKGSQTLKDINSELSGLDTKYHLSEYDIQALARIEGKIYRKHLSSSECAAIGTRVYYTIRRYRFGNAKQVRFCLANGLSRYLIRPMTAGCTLTPLNARCSLEDSVLSCRYRLRMSISITALTTAGSSSAVSRQSKSVVLSGTISR